MNNNATIESERTRTYNVIIDSLYSLDNPEPLNTIESNCSNELEAWHSILDKLIAKHPESKGLLIELDDRRCNLQTAMCEEFTKHTIKTLIK